MAIAGSSGGTQPSVEVADLNPGRGASAPLRGARAAKHVSIAIAVAFFVLGLVTREHYGTTWDEAESYEAGRANLGNLVAILAGDDEIEWPWHELPGHQLVLDTLRAATAEALAPLLPDSPAPIGERVFNLALSTAALVLIGLLAFAVTGSAAVAAIATAALALQPKLVAHAQNNPKDLPGLFVFVLGVVAIVRLAQRPSSVRVALAAIAIGLAITTWLPALALVPVAAWLLLAALHDGDAAPARDTADTTAGLNARAARLLMVIGGGLIAALALWPWLWPAPIERLRQIADRLAEFPTGFDVLYFGRLYPSSALPWHYTIGSLLVATPTIVTGLAIVGASEALIERDASRRRLAALALVWIVSLLVLDGLASFHYDGVRHVLAVLPAIALLAALGADQLRSWTAAMLRRRLPERAAVTASVLVLAALAAEIAVDLARIHPYEDAYLTPLARRVEPGANEQRFEIEYWGGSYREVARWLNENAERGASILAPIAPHCLAPYVRPDLMVRERMRPRLAAERSPYLVFMTRAAWYAPLGLDTVVASGPPLYSVRTTVGTLALVYRPEQIPAPLTRPGGPRSTRPSKVESAPGASGQRRRQRR